MKLYGRTKGTAFEKFADAAAKAEAAGTMTYYTLARMAEEQGMPQEVADTFIEMGNQEAVHAGFYATLNGKMQEDIWAFAEKMSKGETAAEAQLMAQAEEVRKAGLDDVANLLEVYAHQEGHHGVMLAELIKKYKK